MPRLAGLEWLWITSCPQADQCGLFRIPLQAEPGFVSSQIAWIGIWPHTAIHVPACDHRKIGWHRAGCEYRHDNRPFLVIRFPGLYEAGLVGKQVECGNDHVGGRNGCPEVAHFLVADILVQSGCQGFMRVAETGQRPEESPPGFFEDGIAKADI